MTMPDMATQLAWMIAENAYQESMARMIMHRDIQYPGLAPVVSGQVPWWMPAIEYTSYDGTGEMSVEANRATDIPLVETQRARHMVRTERRNIGYSYSDAEIAQAQAMGISLPGDKSSIAMRVAEETKDDLFMTGNPAVSWDGMVNNSNITVVTAAKTWETATDLEIAADVSLILSGAWTATNQVRLCDTLLLSPSTLGHLAGRPFGNDARMTVLAWIMANNIYTLMTGQQLTIRQVAQLETAGAGGVKRAIAYPRNAQVLRFHVLMDLAFGEPQRMGFEWFYYGRMVLGGLEIMEPTAMRYFDGT